MKVEFRTNIENISLKKILYRDHLNSAYKSTICFFREDKKRGRVAAGSGVLISINNSTFVVTAAHVIDDTYDDLFVILPYEELYLGGCKVSTIIPDSDSRN